MARPQRTVRETGEVQGIGLHTGAEVTLRVRPAPPEAGVVFVRTDQPGAPRIPANADHLGTRQRRTALVVIFCLAVLSTGLLVDLRVRKNRETEAWVVLLPTIQVAAATAAWFLWRLARRWGAR